MAYDIGPKIGIDGEAEFRKQINQVNASIKTMGTEMAVVVSEFDAGDRSQEKLTKQSELLNRQITAQKEKLDLLRKGLGDATEKFGDADTRTQKWAQAVNQATADLNKLERQLDDVNEDMNGGILSKLKGELSGLGDSLGLGPILTKGLGVTAVVGGIKELGSTMFELVDSTQEYRAEMGKLTTAYEAAGKSSETATETYRTLQGVIGETDQAVEAAQQIALLADAEEDAAHWADLAAGVVGRFGDALQPETFFEAANETLKLGEATGAYTQMLEGAGYSVDDFNAGLAACNSTEEKQAYLLGVTDEILGEAAKAYRETNAEVIKTNEANEKLNAATARLGGLLAPVASGIKSLAADALNYLLDELLELPDAIGGMISSIRTVGRDIVTGLWNGINDRVTWLGNKIRSFCSDALSSIKNFFGIRSPSRVMRDEVGKYMADGIGVGFANELGTVRRRMDAAMDELVPYSGTTISGTTARVGTTGTTAGGGTISVEMLRQALDGMGVYMDGRRVGKLINQYQRLDEQAAFA